jgi:hypothetical protein
MDTPQEGTPLPVLTGDSDDRDATGDAEADGLSDAPDLLTADGLDLLRTFTSIKDARVRRQVIDLVRTLAQGAHWS